MSEQGRDFQGFCATACAKFDFRKPMTIFDDDYEFLGDTNMPVIMSDTNSGYQGDTCYPVSGVHHHHCIIIISSGVISQSEHLRTY